ncbi:MAG: NAD(P)-dependent oxidoreductase [Candidatus Nitrosopolaris sp.]
MFKHRNVLVTGGTGLIGSHVVEELLKQQANVTITTHSKQNIFPASVNAIKADLTNIESCRSVVKDRDYVIHCAAVSGGLGKHKNDPLSTLKPNLRITANILEAIEDYPPDVFHFTSNNSIYPDEGHPMKEEEARPPITGLASHYSQLKLLGESYCRILFERKNIKIAITRGGNAYGKNDNFDAESSHTVPANIRKAVERQNPFIIWGDGTNIRDYTHASDIAKGVLRAMELYAVADPVNIATGIATSVNELVRKICVIAGHNSVGFTHDISRPGGPNVKLMDTTKMKEKLRFTPQLSMETGLKESVNWFVNNVYSNEIAQH